jgi:DNA ligase D-like protein (predicted 3'-phosphoesterase)
MPEPAASADPRFVLHEHFAHHHHFDLRLEKDGVLKSWAVPKGLPERPKDRRLAIATEDHPLEYLGFTGTIPDGQYGAGTVSVADTGTYRPVVWERDRIEVVFSGAKYTGTYLLLPFARAGKGQWLILKKEGPVQP